MKKTFLTAEWSNLIMANYSVDPAVLLPHLPAKTELDQYNGNVYLSVVGFMFNNVRVLGLKIPFHVNFEEVNLRFYVRHHDGNEWKRGVVFIQEIVPKRAISFIANTFYREKYRTMPMAHFLKNENDHLHLGYQWKKNGKWHSIDAKVEEQPIEMAAGSEEEFIAEHYWGYSRYNSDITVEYEVSHPRWKIFPLLDYHIDCGFAELYGPEFSFLQGIKPSSVFVSGGSPVAVMQKGNI